MVIGSNGGIQRVKWYVSDSDYQFIEREVELYPLSKKKLNEAIQNMILSTPVHDDNGGGRSNLPGRPVESIVVNLFEDARITKLRKYVDAIEFAFNELDEEKQRFVTRLFWSSNSKSILGICREFHIHRNTYTTWKKSFLLRVGLITGDFRGDIYQ